jgi:hypothetical protein
MFTTWNFSTLDEHNKIMVISSLFCWHLFFVVIFLFIQVWLIEICFDSSKNVPCKINKLGYNKLNIDDEQDYLEETEN